MPPIRFPGHPTVPEGCPAVGRTLPFIAAVCAALACGDRGKAPPDTATVAEPQAPAVAPPDASTAPGPATVSMHGIGKLRVGMTVGEARAALGSLTLDSIPRGASCTYGTSRVLPRGVSVLVENGRIGRVDVDSSGTATVEGARVGDTEERIRSLYGARVAMTPHKYTNGHYLTVTAAAPADSIYRTIFETQGGVVTRYRAGHLPQVAYVEGCS